MFLTPHSFPKYRIGQGYSLLSPLKSMVLEGGNSAQDYPGRSSQGKGLYLYIYIHIWKDKVICQYSCAWCSLRLQSHFHTFYQFILCRTSSKKRSSTSSITTDWWKCSCVALQCATVLNKQGSLVWGGLEACVLTWFEILISNGAAICNIKKNIFTFRFYKSTCQWLLNFSIKSIFKQT